MLSTFRFDTSDSVHTYAIGDVHGCADLLNEMLWGIKRRARRAGFKYRIVFLGDIVDRGPDSKRAIDLVIEALAEVPGSRLILGNHDWLLLRILENEGLPDEAKYCAHWLGVGGAATLRSYGYTESSISAPKLRVVIGEDHINCLQAAAQYVELDHHILVHAGMRPGIALKDQNPYDLMWIRDDFLTHKNPFGKKVVHGHTITSSLDVEMLPNRIAIDTGAYKSGILTALEITPSGKVDVVQAVQTAIPGMCRFRE